MGHRVRLRRLDDLLGYYCHFCASSAILADKFFGFDPKVQRPRAFASIIPILLLLSILNLLPLIFQTIARFYEQLKSTLEVDLSVVERFFRFQFAGMSTCHIYHGHPRALAAGLAVSPGLRADGRAGTPRVSFYFAKLLAFQCGASPLVVVEDLALVSHCGFKFYTVQPPNCRACCMGGPFPRC